MLTNVYPNPSSNEITISGLAEDSKLSIFSSEGRLIETEAPTTENFCINISNWKNATYFFKIVK